MWCETNGMSKISWYTSLQHCIMLLCFSNSFAGINVESESTLLHCRSVFWDIFYTVIWQIELVNLEDFVFSLSHLCENLTD